jgi:hypothetical protein
MFGQARTSGSMRRRRGPTTTLSATTCQPASFARWRQNRPSVVEREEPSVPIERRVARQPVLSSPVPAQMPPSGAEHVGVRQRDHDVASRDPAELMECGVDSVDVLEHVERDDDVDLGVGQGNSIAQVSDDVGRRMEIQAHVPNRAALERVAKLSAAASDIK